MCDKNITISNNNYSCWENKKTTRDEREIIDYLKLNNQLINNKQILHIGIGNSEFGQIFYNKTKLIDGVTITGNERKKGETLQCYNNIYLCNKYNINDMKKKCTNNYDIIIDQGIKCYTCCDKHFEDLFDFYVKKLNENGTIIISLYGMNWSGYDLFTKIKTGLIKQTRDGPNKQKNIFTMSELNKFKKKYNFDVEQINNILFLKFKKKISF